MCDYSLHSIESRPAKIGDHLITTQFPNTITSGFSGVGEPNIAVCLLPGTELVFDKPIERDHMWRPFHLGRTTAITARFRQFGMDIPHQHHDALELPNGKIIMLTRLIPGQTATVIQMPVDATAPVRDNQFDDFLRRMVVALEAHAVVYGRDSTIVMTDEGPFDTSTRSFVPREKLS